MHVAGQDLIYSASDLSDFLACRHLTTQEVARARGGPRPPKFDDPGAEVIRRRGHEHEAKILDQYRAETLGERSIEDWMKAGEEILPLFPSSAILLATMGRMGASCGAEDVARKHLEDSLESGGAHASFVLTEVALGYASLGEDGLAFAMGEKALVCAEDAQDEKDAAATIEQVCERLGCPERAESHIHQAKKNRMEQTMAKRRDRRRKDKKGKGRRR